VTPQPIMSRTRETYDDTTPGPTTCEVRYASFNGSGWNPYGALETKSIPAHFLNSGREVIIDSTERVRAVKPVTHTKRKFTRRQVSQSVEYTNSIKQELNGTSSHNWSWGFYGELDLNNLITSYPKSINQLKAEAMHKFMSSNEVDTLLNVIEAPQLVSSAHSMRDEMRRQMRYRKGFNITPFVSSGFLAYSFGIAPLIADINKINAAAAQFKRDIDTYQRSLNKSYRVSAVSTGTFSTSISAPGYSPNSGNDDSSYWHVGVNPTIPPTLRVGLVGKRNAIFNTQAFNKLDYVLKRFIATGPVSLAVERVPFSFVLEWFVNLSGLVDALDNTLTGSNKNIEAIWSSEKWAALVPVFKHKYNRWTCSLDGEQTALNEISYYHRESISPDPTIALSGRFGKKQAFLTGALLHQLVSDLRGWR